MRYVRLRDLGQGWETKSLMTLALADARQAGGADFDEVERRTRLIRSLRSVAGDAQFLPIEDADHRTLANIMLQYKWATVSPELSDILCDVRDAPAELPASGAKLVLSGNHRDESATALQ